MKIQTRSPPSCTAIMSLSCGQTGTHANPYEQNTTHPAKLPGIRHQVHGWMMSKLPPSYIHLLSFSKIHEGFLGTICHAISVHLHKIFSNVSTWLICAVQRWQCSRRIHNFGDCAWQPKPCGLASEVSNGCFRGTWLSSVMATSRMKECLHSHLQCVQYEIR